MAGQINLIPEKHGLVENTPLARRIRKITVSLALIIIILGGAGGGFWYLRNQELNSLKARRDDLKSEVLRLQQNEGGLVLLRDRLQKAQTILADREQYKAVEFFDSFVESFGGSVELSEVSVESGTNKITLVVSDSSLLSQVVTELENNTTYPNITLESVNFSSSSGYTVIVSVL